MPKEENTKRKGRMTKEERAAETERLKAEAAQARAERKRKVNELTRKLWKEEEALIAKQATAVAKGRMGRPTTYTADKAASLCAWVASGGSLGSWCRKHGESMATVYRWRAAQADFREQLAHAQQQSADSMADYLLDIADEPAPPEGLTMEDIQLRKLRIDTRKWIAARLKPAVWGDHPPQQANTGQVIIQIGIPPAAPKPETITAVDASPLLDC